MINRTKQNWAIGATVKVGFLSLIVLEVIATPGYFKPDAYILQNTKGDKMYKFVPHNGLSQVSESEVAEMRNLGQAFVF